ncbi:MAG: cation:proton antiporter [Deltaproteobacteria bacterium]|nr:cation:proton antiporter [Deltaproteobacteria bacterium]
MNFLEISFKVSFVLIALAFVLTVIRLLKGPSLPDRVVALDSMSYLALSLMVTYSMYSGQEVLLDPAIALALIAFLSTVAFAKYIEKKGGSDE